MNVLSIASQPFDVSAHGSTALLLPRIMGQREHRPERDRGGDPRHAGRGSGQRDREEQAHEMVRNVFRLDDRRSPR